MKVKQLRNVMDLENNQRVRVIDSRTETQVETEYSWVLDIDRYEHERVMNLTVDGVVFMEDWLIIHAH